MISAPIRLSQIIGKRTLGVAAVFAVVTSIFSTSPAVAKLTICKKTADSCSIAVAYSQNKKWTSEGWWIIKPDACSTVVRGDLRQRYDYY